MYCLIKCTVQGKQTRVKNADLRHPSCTFVMYKRKSASPVLNVLRMGARGSAVALQVGRSRFRCPMLSLEFFIDIILPAALWPWA